ncbi:MAG: ShlB/FhaC/HecB family hemolysin secretion/activation protein [Candidatus Eremiobacterota bacterium]
MNSLVVGVLALCLAGSALAQSPEPQVTVKVTELRLEGATVLAPADVEGLLAPHRGKEMTYSELRGVADAITELYRSKGYFTCRASLPAQDIKDGVVVLRAVESKLGQVKVEGNEEYSSEFIRWYMEPALERELPLEPELQRQLLLLNELSGLKASTILEAGQTPGTVDMVVNVKDETPIFFSLDYNNLGSRFTGFDRPGLSLDIGNRFGIGERFLLRGVRSIADPGVTLGTFSFQTPINNEGTRVGAFYSNASYQVGRELQLLDIRGDANVFGLTVSHALERSTDASMDVSGGFLYQDINNSLLGFPLSRDRLRALYAGISGDWAHNEGRTFAAFRTTQDLGQALGGMAPDDPLSSRAAGGGYNVFNLDAIRVQRLGGPAFFIFTAQGQAATRPLPNAAQFALGGLESVRGYRQAAFLGDDGYDLSAEFRVNVLDEQDDTVQVAAFVDHGHASLQRPFPGELSKISLTGAGAGLRFNLPEQTYLRFDLGFPIGSNAVTRATGRDPVPYVIFGKTF